MKIAVICNTDALAMPSIHFLKEKGYLAGVGVLEKNKKYLQQPLLDLGVAGDQLSFFKKEAWIAEKKQWLESMQPDMVWVFGFPWKFPVSMTSIPTKGFYNFHFGLLPKYKGADPVFWQIRNMEQKGGFVIHEVSEDIDEGPVVWREETPMAGGETAGLYYQRMGFTAAGILDKFIEKAISGEREPKWESSTALYFAKPDLANLTIRWKEQSADEIEWLINAANPKYGGATTKLRGMEVRFLEVTPADVTDAPEVEPGMVVHADAVYGLIVACKDKKFIRVNVVSMREGYMSGVKLFALGVKPGDMFHE